MVPYGGVVAGKGITQMGIVEHIGHVSVKALRVLATSILNVTNVIPEEQALSLPNHPQFDSKLQSYSLT